ncbi:MAG: signal peptidase I [Planctomycetes bacterium]|nr:signal peptidase I [Planctomycetota bacterium]
MAPETDAPPQATSATATSSPAGPTAALPTPRVESWVPPVTSANTARLDAGSIAPEAAPIELPWAPARRLPGTRTRSRNVALRSLWTSAKIGAVLFVAYGLMFNFSVVRGSSMAPGIHDGDRILVDHLSYVFQDVHRGDIVVLQYPLDPSLDYIKRVIGLPGDHVEIHDGAVWVNGERLREPYVAEEDARARLAITVAPEHFFVLGDNRPHSSDSREFGQVPRQNLRGKVEVRVWPPERIGTLE